MQTKVSIIIPCYNHGAYIQEAVNSVEKNAGDLAYEVIIIDDGSTETETLSVLDSLLKSGYNVIRQANQGLAAARNNAIAAARGTYILPLDSDNMVHENYLNKAVNILDSTPTIDIIYGQPMFFGDSQGLQRLEEFDFFKMIRANYIDACAIFRREVWVKVNGFDGNMPVMGNEDWEFWLHSFLTGSNFFYLNDICFYYRVVANSMSASTTRPGYELNKAYIYKKHAQYVIEELIKLMQKKTDVVNYIDDNRLVSMAKLAVGYKFGKL